MPDEQVTKPPLGVIPTVLAEVRYLANRNKELLDAMHRYIIAGKDVPEDWHKEIRYNLDRAVRIDKLGLNYKPWEDK